MNYEPGFPQVLTRRYRNDALLSLSERQRGGCAGYGEAKRTVCNQTEYEAAIAEGFGDAGPGMRYPVVLELSAIPGGAPKQKFTANSDQEYANICAQGWADGRTVAVAKD